MNRSIKEKITAQIADYLIMYIGQSKKLSAFNVFWGVILPEDEGYYTDFNYLTGFSLVRALDIPGRGISEIVVSDKPYEDICDYINSVLREIGGYEGTISKEDIAKFKELNIFLGEPIFSQNIYAGLLFSDYEETRAYIFDGKTKFTVHGIDKEERLNNADFILSVNSDMVENLNKKPDIYTYLINIRIKLMDSKFLIKIKASDKLSHFQRDYFNAEEYQLGVS